MTSQSSETSEFILVHPIQYSIFLVFQKNFKPFCTVRGLATNILPRFTSQINTSRGNDLLLINSFNCISAQLEQVISIQATNLWWLSQMSHKGISEAVPRQNKKRVAPKYMCVRLSIPQEEVICNWVFYREAPSLVQNAETLSLYTHSTPASTCIKNL